MDWFGRARKMMQGLGTEEPPAPQYYRVTCPQGHVLRGQRTEGYQAIRCPGCGEGLFVLPRSPLPQPPAPPVDRPKQRASRPEPVVDDEIQWVDAPAEVALGDAPRPNPDEIEIQWEEDVADEAPPSPVEPVTAARAARPAKQPRPAPLAPTGERPGPPRDSMRPRPAVVASVAGSAPQVMLAPRPTWGQRLRRHRHSLAILGVLAFVAATIAFRMNQRYWEQLPEVAEINRTEGLQALESGLFDVAKRKLSEAADALEALADPKAAEVRQSAREAAIFADLATLSLEEIVEEVATREPTASLEWFESRHRGRSVLIDAHLATTGRGGLTVDYRIYSGGKRGWLDLTDLRLLAGKPDGSPATFGARLAGITLDETGEWRISFDPDSGVYLSTSEGWEGLKTLGWPSRELPGGEVGATTMPAVLGILTGVRVLPQAEPPTIRPQDLSTRADLIDRAVIVDGRVDRFDFQKDRGWNQLRLLGSTVRCLLPNQLAYPTPPTQKVARLQGVLRRENSGMRLDVTSITLFDSDLARVQAATASLAASDAKNRDAWARWAERRAQEYRDDELLAKARQLAGDAVRIEADRPDAIGSPERQLELARQARERQVPPPVPASLVHRALRQRLPGVTQADEAEQLAKATTELLPAAARSRQDADIRGWLAAYEEDPAATYRRADGPARAALDRRLLADALRKAFELRAAEEPELSLALADRAEDELPEDSALARSLRRNALAKTDVAALRLAEVRERARLYESMGQPDEARDLLRRWLTDQRNNRLSPSDAEGRVLLAEQYVNLIDDQATAVELLREAWDIDPGAEPIAAAFRQRGYRQVDGAWVASGRAEAKNASAPSRDGPPEEVVLDVGRDPFLGRTSTEVVDLMGGKPSRVARSVTQGQIREQWIYELGGQKLQYINFIYRPGQPRALVVASFQRSL